MAFDPSGISLHVGRGLSDGLNVQGWSEERVQVSGVRWSDGRQDAGPEWGKDAEERSWLGTLSSVSHGLAKHDSARLQRWGWTELLSQSVASFLEHLLCARRLVYTTT